MLIERAELARGLSLRFGIKGGVRMEEMGEVVGDLDREAIGRLVTDIIGPNWT